MTEILEHQTLEHNGKTFVAADQPPYPEWPCVNSDFPRPTLTLKDDEFFLITDTLGNIACAPGQENNSLGLFCRDTRFLSRMEIQIEERAPILLSSTAQRGYAMSVLCANPFIEELGLRAETIGIQREIVLNSGLFEELTVTNYSTTSVEFALSLSFDADFIDLFEVRGFGREKRGQILRLVHTGERTISDPGTPAATETVNPSPTSQELTLAYQGLDGVVVESRIQFYLNSPSELKGNTAIWRLQLDPHGSLSIGYRLQPLLGGTPTSAVGAPMNLPQARAAGIQEEQSWRQHITQIRSDSVTFNRMMEQAEKDIYLLRQTFERGQGITAGIPWFATLFGRDSIITASQTLMLDSTIARETLKILAAYQGKEDNEWRDEEPGKILHELRLGEMARCEEIPHTPYYGTIDATPLWLMLYAEYYAWTRDRETLEHLWPNALAAMEWIDRNCQATGYLAYDRRSKKGLINQGWKDSGDCIVDRYGHLAQGPIALCEVQAYVYAAKVRLSELAVVMQAPDLATRWISEAETLKTRFNQDFWLPEEEFCALALAGDGHVVDSISSNPGHCLYLGILEDEKAHSVAERLLAPDLFNGWGIRTLSSRSPAYNPMGYHVGSVWPHDNGLIALGLRSLGLIESALEVAQGLIDMTLYQPYYRPPELFCGYERSEINDRPVRYPVACSPQAWATGTLFQLIGMMINMVPDAPNNKLRIIDPALVPSINQLCIQNLRVGDTVLELEFERDEDQPESLSVACRVVRKRGNLRVVIEA